MHNLHLVLRSLLGSVVLVLRVLCLLRTRAPLQVDGPSFFLRGQSTDTVGRVSLTGTVPQGHDGGSPIPLQVL